MAGKCRWRNFFVALCLYVIDILFQRTGGVWYVRYGARFVESDTIGKYWPFFIRSCLFIDCDIASMMNGAKRGKMTIDPACSTQFDNLTKALVWLESCWYFVAVHVADAESTDALVGRNGRLPLRGVRPAIHRRRSQGREQAPLRRFQRSTGRQREIFLLFELAILNHRSIKAQLLSILNLIHNDSIQIQYKK